MTTGELAFYAQAMEPLINAYVIIFFMVVGVIFGAYLLMQLIYSILMYYNATKTNKVLLRLEARPLWLKDMAIGIFITAFSRCIITLIFTLLLPEFPEKSQIMRRGLDKVPTPFIGNLSIVQYVDTMNFYLGFLSFVLVVAHLFAGTFIAFSFGNKFFKSLGMAILFAAYFLLFVGFFFNIIAIGLGQ